MKELSQKQIEKLEKLPIRYRKLLQDVYCGGTDGDPIEAFCYECLGWDSNLIREGCVIDTCPLFNKSILKKTQDHTRE